MARFVKHPPVRFDGDPSPLVPWSPPLDPAPATSATPPPAAATKPRRQVVKKDQPAPPGAQTPAKASRTAAAAPKRAGRLDTQSFTGQEGPSERRNDTGGIRGTPSAAKALERRCDRASPSGLAALRTDASGSGSGAPPV